MKCKCGENGIENQALNKTFWYCRACKDEIRLETKAYLNLDTIQDEELERPFIPIFEEFFEQLEFLF